MEHIGGVRVVKEAMWGKGVEFLCNTAPYQVMQLIASPTIASCANCAITMREKPKEMAMQLIASEN